MTGQKFGLLIAMLLATAWVIVRVAAIMTGQSVFAADINKTTPTLTVATWNLEHLAAVNGAGCRPRNENDYAALRRMAIAINADIIAVQEVENTAALARVFPPRDYVLEMAQQPARVRPSQCQHSAQRMTAQLTGFAIRRARLRELGWNYHRLPDVQTLGKHGMRWGTAVQLTAPHSATPMTLLSLHLKAGCAWGQLETGANKRYACQVLRQQRGELEKWIDAQAANDQPFIIMGDFNRQLDQPGDAFWREIDDSETCRWQPNELLGQRCIAGSIRYDADADLTLAHAGVPFPFAHQRRYPYAIDHFVYDGRSAAWIISDSYHALAYPDNNKPPLSDHHPLRMQIRLLIR